ncbi:MAG: prepilin-type N-terminal cleavage/methylation domain-containing protein [Candidatus Omnitrophota bacterium]|nr:prepilin-type N-terminal cleavage/methylation domain-containing protein [Candidatus Omnitrophota bacterium]
MKKGFTLLELIIVIIIIGILAAIAIPRITEIAERGRSGEGLQILGALRSAQLRYRADHAGYTNTIGNLDISFTTQRYFTASALAAVGDDNSCASALRNAADRPTNWGAYTFCITPNGGVSCVNSGGAVTECARLGYTAVAACP